MPATRVMESPLNEAVPELTMYSPLPMEVALRVPPALVIPRQRRSRMKLSAQRATGRSASTRIMNATAVRKCLVGILHFSLFFLSKVFAGEPNACSLAGANLSCCCPQFANASRLRANHPDAEQQREVVSSSEPCCQPARCLSIGRATTVATYDSFLGCHGAVSTSLSVALEHLWLGNNPTLVSIGSICRANLALGQLPSYQWDAALLDGNKG